MELAISTIILLVIGIIVLIGLISILAMGWDDFSTSIKAALGSDTAKMKRQCTIYCSMDNVADYCTKVKIGDVEYDCNDAAIKPADCSLTCPQE